MEQKKYYIGIDAGTSSVGWAVTDPAYQIVKKNGKALWGSRLFEEATTAEKRRMARSSRRRGDRKTFRMALLRELFAEEITRVDPAFYLRLDESKFWEEDKKVPSKNALFYDSKFNDCDYYRAYPTIYHLRKELMESGEKHDIRLVYLAVAHLMKHRGHFYSQMSETATLPDFESSWEKFIGDARDLLEIDVSCDNLEELKEVLQEKMAVRDKCKKVKTLIAVPVTPDTVPFSCIGDLLSGKVTDISKSFGVSLEGDEKNALKVCFDSEDMEDEEKLSTYHRYLGDNLQILLDLKELYDWGILVGILHGSDSISAAKIQSYEKHKGDLKKLQKVIKADMPGKYNEVFRMVQSKLDNYCAYTGHYDRKNKNYAAEAHRCSREKFYKYLKSVLKDCQGAEEILTEMELGTFLPLQRDKENSVIPYQMNLKELRKILDHASTYHPFLLEKDRDGISVREKIESLLTFRIPYYVGPLDNTNAKPGTHWAVKKDPQTRVLPWNFEKVVDKEASAKAFMERLTNTCTYLIGEPVLPKDSISYSRFMALNELNHVTVFGHRLPVAVKQKAFNELFLKRSHVTGKALASFLRAEGLLKKGEEDAIGGIDGDFNTSLKVEQKLRDIFVTGLPTQEQMEVMILSVLLLKQEPEMLHNRLLRIYPTITESQMKRVCSLPCNGWGRLSEKFLTGLKADLPDMSGSSLSILDAMWETQNDLMQLLSYSMPYHKLIEEHNEKIMDGTQVNYQTIENLSAPPAIRRTVWQTLKLVEEITHIMGGTPEKIFVEMARGADGTGRTVSRKDQLMRCYQEMKSEGTQWVQKLDGYDNPRLRQDKLYLYFTQMGRCMYTGERIDLDALLNDTGNQIYDIDHIYPRSKVKDDSLDNRVLVCKKANQDKSDTYPLDAKIRHNQFPFWSYLHEHKLISKIKLERLTRGTEFSEDELAGFISRQLVETRQSTKLLAQLLKQVLPDTRIVYVKAGNVSDFRQQFQLVKVRDLNDLHHAKDAYLNIVVGNVYDVKFTADPRHFLHSGEPYSMKPEVLFRYPVKRNGITAWCEQSIETVKKNYRKNNIFVTRMEQSRTSGQNGGFYDQNPVREGSVPLKKDPRMANTSRYGGYNKETGAYMMLVEHQKGKKRIRSLEPVYLRFAEQIKNSPHGLEEYCEKELGLIEPNVLIPKILFYTLLEINGFRFWLTGRSGAAQIVGVQAFELVLPPETERYLKKVLRVCERLTAVRGNLDVTSEYDRVTAVENMALYEQLLEKMQISAYSSRPSSQVETIRSGREKFEQLSLAEQCKAIAAILALFRGNGKSDLTEIGGAKTAGAIQFSKNISEDFQIIYQSVTGFYCHGDKRLSP